MSKEDRNQQLAEKFGMQIYSGLLDFELVRFKNGLIPYLVSKEKSLLCVEETETVIKVAVSDPLNLIALDEIRLLLKKEIEPVFCPKPALDHAIEHVYHKQNWPLGTEEASNHSENKDRDAAGYDLLDTSSQNPTVRVLNSLIMDAIQQGASDIHFEPREKGLMVRYRIDGILQKRHSPSKDVQSQMLTRLKVMAKMDIAEHRLPQDGRIKLNVGDREIDFRVSTIPIVRGERIVLRILDKGNLTLGLDQLGMDDQICSDFRNLIHFPEGIILVTGPTGSGKTTTLYIAISEISSSKVNIMTIEDPVEYKLQNIAQMGVNPKIKLGFSTGLRHILRQDPDVILIGEIRDRETAEIAIQSSLTGHLVFSTLHTNDAPSAIARLTDMGIENYLLSSTILGILAQRLIRKICEKCKTSYTPDPSEIKQLALPDTTTRLYRGTGCEACFGSGYKGRQGIYELMLMTPNLRSQISKGMDTHDLRQIQKEMGTLKSSGAKLVEKGITTVQEVLRVAKTIG